MTKKEIKIHEEKYLFRTYGYRGPLALFFGLIWCSWKGHHWKRDYRGNKRCKVCFYSKVD